MSAGRVRKLEAEYDLQVRYTYFPLHPETPPEGRPLADLFAGREARLDGMRSRLVALMSEEGLEYGDRTHTYNSRLAQELAVWGDEESVTDALHDALYRAYFVDALNLVEMDVLVDVAESVGLDGTLARAVVEDRTKQGTIDDHWSRAMEMGVRGVPTFVSEGFGVVGAQPYEALEDLVTRAGAVRPGTDR